MSWLFLGMVQDTWLEGEHMQMSINALGPLAQTIEY